MRFFANENVPGPAVRRLRELGHDVVWAKEDFRGAADHVLLAQAQVDQRVTVTCDTDFGELAFHSGLPATCGVVLLRVEWTDPTIDNAWVVSVLTSRDDWVGVFAVVERDRVRIRPLPEASVVEGDGTQNARGRRRRRQAVRQPARPDAPQHEKPEWRQLDDPDNPENRNAGNGGDLCKHTVYMTVLDYLLRHSPWSDSLRVRECHAGRGMYRIPGDDSRRPLLGCLYDPVDADTGFLLHDVQRASLSALGMWPADREAFEWYAGSAVLNGWQLGRAETGRHLHELYEENAETRTILRSICAEPGLQFPRLDVRILPEPEHRRPFDGERHIEGNVSAWNSQDLILLDPFAMWRQDEDQIRRNRYRSMIERLIARGPESPLLILFWTWGNAFPVADGDLDGTNTPAVNGYQELRTLLHQENRHFVRVKWRWKLQFAMWIIITDSHLNELCAALQHRCDELRDYLLRHGCKDRLANPNIEVSVD
jgi:predicted nuclease of predicted toxin-antitoxin system